MNRGHFGAGRLNSLPSAVLWIVLLAALMAACTSASGLEAVPGAARQTIPAGEAAQTSTETTSAAQIPAASTATQVLLPTATLSPTPSPSPSPLPTEVPITTLLFVGNIVPARCVQAAIDEQDDYDYPYDAVREIIQQADLAVGVLNATLSAVTERTGCVSTYVLVGDPRNADAMASAGFDMMSVATNHIKDCGSYTCGDQAFLDTLENLQRVGVLPVGAGLNHASASEPVVVTLNGVRFGFVSQGQLEQGGVFAGPDQPGIAVLNRETIPPALAAAREVSDVVIAMPHWGPEDVSWPNYLQRDLAHRLVKAGADLVVGNHTHVVQAVQDIDGVPVFYGLGNFVFDQGLETHQQAVILLVRYQGTRLLGYELIPTVVDRTGRVRLADPNESDQILSRIEEAGRDLR